jgi:hypothetical protein
MSGDIRIMSNLTVYAAIKQMRRLSQMRQPFSFTFMSWSETKQKSNGIVEVRSARVKNRTKQADFRNTDFIEEYIDLDTMEHRRFYQPLLMTFNGQKLELANDRYNQNQ